MKKIAAIFHAAADAVETWMIESGFLDQLAYLVAKTALPRMIVGWVATYFFSAGLLQGSTAEIIFGAVATVLIGTVNLFIQRVRNKHAAPIQALAGVTPDRFIGPETVAAVRELVAQPPATPVAMESQPQP